jgi:hypothetical protein
MKKSRLKPQMSTSSISRSASVSTITTTTITSILSDGKTINTRIEYSTKGLPYCFNYISNKVLPGSRGKENTLTICDYISSMKSV